MTRGLASALALEALLLAGIGVTALDMRAHSRVENLGGVNIWGYRGPVLPAKRANEVRVAIVGGDLAFGWGVAPTETLAPYVRRLVALEIEIPGAAGRNVTATTAGAMGLAPAEYAGWLAHVAFLQSDVVCLVIDPPDHAGSDNVFLPDRGSLAFRRFGYSPILPLVLQEKGALVGSRAVRSAGVMLAAIDDRLSDRRAAANPAMSGIDYLNAIDEAARAGLRVAAAGVVIVVPAPVGGAADFSPVAAELSSRFDRQRRVRVVDLGRDPRLRAASLRLDGFNLGAAGHSLTAELVSPPVVELIRAEQASR
jgi:hypothetical protein